MQVILVACFDFLVFELVRFVLMFAFSVFDLASGFWWVEFLGRFKCLLWWFIS